MAMPGLLFERLVTRHDGPNDLRIESGQAMRSACGSGLWLASEISSV